MVCLCGGVAECLECIRDTSAGLSAELEKDCAFFRVDMGRVVRHVPVVLTGWFAVAVFIGR